jgi:hypothetical protein
LGGGKMTVALVVEVDKANLILTQTKLIMAALGAIDPLCLIQRLPRRAAQFGQRIAGFDIPQPDNLRAFNVAVGKEMLDYFFKHFGNAPQHLDPAGALVGNGWVGHDLPSFRRGLA